MYLSIFSAPLWQTRFAPALLMHLELICITQKVHLLLASHMKGQRVTKTAEQKVFATKTAKVLPASSADYALIMSPGRKIQPFFRPRQQIPLGGRWVQGGSGNRLRGRPACAAAALFVSLDVNSSIDYAAYAQSTATQAKRRCRFNFHFKSLRFSFFFVTFYSKFHAGQQERRHTHTYTHKQIHIQMQIQLHIHSKLAAVGGRISRLSSGVSSV